MAEESSAFAEGAGERQSLDWSKKDEYRRRFVGQATRSFIRIAFGMGVVAFALPLLVMVSGKFGPHYSISHYYYGGDTARGIFIGSLWSTGLFLMLFQGLSLKENLLLRTAGIAAIGVSMFPMGSDQCSKGLTPHGGFAGLFFVCLAIVAIFYSKERVKFIIYEPLKRTLVTGYNITGTLMVVLPITVAVLYREAPHVDGGVCHSNDWVFWFETFAIWSFSGYWFGDYILDATGARC